MFKKNVKGMQQNIKREFWLPTTRSWLRYSYYLLLREIAEFLKLKLSRFVIWWQTDNKFETWILKDLWNTNLTRMFKHPWIHLNNCYNKSWEETKTSSDKSDEIFWRWRKFCPTKNLVRRKFGPKCFLKCHRKLSIKRLLARF